MPSSISFEGLRFVQANDVFDGIRSSACERHIYRFVRLFSLHLCLNHSTNQARTLLNQGFIHPITHALSLVLSHYSGNVIAE